MRQRNSPKEDIQYLLEILHVDANRQDKRKRRQMRFEMSRDWPKIQRFYMDLQQNPDLKPSDHQSQHYKDVLAACWTPRPEVKSAAQKLWEKFVSFFPSSEPDEVQVSE